MCALFYKFTFNLDKTEDQMEEPGGFAGVKENAGKERDGSSRGYFVWSPGCLWRLTHAIRTPSSIRPRGMSGVSEF